MPDPDGRDEGGMFAALERQFTDASPEPTDATDVDDVGESGQVESIVSAARSGFTARVARLAEQVAEARELVALQADPAPLAVESDRVVHRRRAMREAAVLHELAQDPDAIAYGIARWRRALTALGTLALVAGLAWSTVGVQRTAAGSAPTGSGAWWFAWLVEPAISSVLLLCVAARVYVADRGGRLRSRAVTFTEVGALAMTLTLNTWPYLTGQAPHPVLVLVHAVGPLVAMAAVACLTAVWGALAQLPVADTGAPAGDRVTDLTGPAYRHNVELDRRLTEVRTLIDRGQLPPAPSANAIRTALQPCGMDLARQIRDALTTHTPES
jgi:hypothetical protein